MQPGLGGCPELPGLISGCLTPDGIRKVVRAIRDAYQGWARLYNRCRDPKRPPAPLMAPKERTTP